jgi:c-di-GMP-binding flagellar brake protein YcgR
MNRQTPGLVQLIDPARPVFYLTLGDSTREVIIRRVATDHFIVDLSDDLKGLEHVSGFVVAKDAKGIIPVDCTVRTGKTDQEKFDVIILAFNPAQLKLINQREFYRLALATRNKVQIISSDGRKYTVDLLNISAGGVGFIAQEYLSSKQIYQITFPLWESGITLILAIKIVYYKEKQTPTEGPYHGAQFIRNRELTAYPVLTDSIQEKIIQNINRRLIELRKVKED